ncbi:membrane protein [Mycolicibacterium anyangense]|uniref:Membrane protein n=1 Tax=Mycolicibacterium anyangense TaxID=1431246 RepID=A0A6N4WF22_9MYCO|nr:DUF3556 domain-containing protein [Mycolicibacterium anyangense]BBZ78684.1 membrane protein [Mycolicibacterium anyangense]
MSFTQPDLPAVDPHEFLAKPLLERIRILSTNWVEHGFGTPLMVSVIYIVKVTVLYALGGVVIATATSGLPAFWHVSQWWDQPIVYQKLILWTVLLESAGLGGSWGPLAGKVKPMTGGVQFWLRRGTIRLRPWAWVPFTSGNRRSWVDTGLYAAMLLSLAVALLSPGRLTPSLLDRLPDNTSGLVSPTLLIAPIGLLILVGLRDKVIFLAARGEQYLPALAFFAVLPFTDMIVALKLLIVVVWVGAGVSKFGRHFARVIPPMTSNSPTVAKLLWFKRAMYRDPQNDLQPSRLAEFMGHVLGTAVEIVTPLVLLFSHNRSLTVAGIVLIVGLHFYIISAFPLAVPLEWNVLFSFAAVFLFLGFPAWAGYAVGDMSSPWLTFAIVAALVFFPILGNFRPDKVSFLPSMRQYAGNWACSVWAFAPGAEAKLDRVKRMSTNQLDQFVAYGYEPEWAAVTMTQPVTFRAMHAQGRGLVSVLVKHLPDIDIRDVREGEWVCNSLIGWNFGDGHLHNDYMIAAVQEQVGYEPGELVVAWVESQAWGTSVQHYKLIDAALGVIETGTWKVADVAEAQPWLPDGPVPTTVTWSVARDGRGAMA